ncbi:flagellar FliJ family protein [Actibacterium sp. MT2.3-13A]|uniref:flagellar FliJ family protein n=1 Tax=Actibacterium sp. MT2.3-13A TaxID=2828332 RepID=UPI001BAE2239|nr:flagellar FliJ family protein [Actibacterium sp. MT2.3-13A]
MARRRIAALALLERLRRHEIEEQARELGALRARIAELERQREALRERLRRDAHVSTIEAAPYLGDFIRSIRREIAVLEAEIARFSPRMDELEAIMQGRFAELKTYETVRLEKEWEMLRQLQRREAAELEELALQRWAR